MGNWGSYIIPVAPAMLWHGVVWAGGRVPHCGQTLRPESDAGGVSVRRPFYDLYLLATSFLWIYEVWHCGRQHQLFSLA